MRKIPMYKLTGRLAGGLLKAYSRRRKPVEDSIATQEKQLLKLLSKAKSTKFGRDHEFASISSVSDFQRRVPLRSYEDFWNDYWSEPFPSLTDVTWPGSIRFFARSSGTSTGQSKFIPCSDEMVKANNIAGFRVLVHHLRNNPDSAVSEGRTFLFGGSPDLEELTPGVFAGELSGIAARETISLAGKDRYYPPRELASIVDWEEKLERVSSDLVNKDIRSISGVPTWLQILFERSFENASITNRRLVSLFPDLELITHGGVNFGPYEEFFSALLEGSEVDVREVYAASEGFIAIADRHYGEGMELLVDNGLFLEFVELDELSKPDPRRRWLADVEVGVDYALIVTSCGGLWSYVIGDIIRFVDLDPPRILMVGRISQTLSTFGEHLTGSELEIAVAVAAKKTGVSVRDFAVAPVSGGVGVGSHRYVIEAQGASADEFANAIDLSLMDQNADYRTKRQNSVVIGPPEVEFAQTGAFSLWMNARGKAGGQHKAPRVTTSAILDEIVSPQP